MSKPLISIGELIDRSWEIFRNDSSKFLTISGWLLVTAILYVIALFLYPSASEIQTGSELSVTETVGLVFYALTMFVVTPLISFWIFTSTARALSKCGLGEKFNVKLAMKEGRQIFFKALLTSVMVVLIVLLAIAIGCVPPAIIAALGSLLHVSSLIIVANVLLVIGIFVSLFLAIKWTVDFIFAPLITVLDNTKSKIALETSKQLTKGRFWSVLARLVVPKLVFVIFGVLAMTVIAQVVDIVLGASSGINLDLQLRIATMTSTIVPIVITVLINPLIVISDVLLLKSLREEKIC